MKKIKNLSISYFLENLITATGIILIWRGIWHLLDLVDLIVFAENTLWTSVGGIFLGLFILFAPDKDLKGLKH